MTVSDNRDLKMIACRCPNNKRAAAQIADKVKRGEVVVSVNQVPVEGSGMSFDEFQELVRENISTKSSLALVFRFRAR